MDIQVVKIVLFTLVKNVNKNPFYFLPGLCFRFASIGGANRLRQSQRQSQRQQQHR